MFIAVQLTFLKYKKHKNENKLDEADINMVLYAYIFIFYVICS